MDRTPETIPLASGTKSTETALDCGAFEQMYAEHAGALHAYLLRRCGNETDAQELVQDAFTEAWRTRAGFRGECAARTWLYAIAINLLRKRWSRKRPIILAELPDMPTPESALPLTVLQTEEGVAALRKAVEALPDDQRDALELVRLEAMSYAEAAQTLGCTVNAVRMRLHKAMIALRCTLAPGRED